jgi:hypothetical protein
MIGAPKKSFLQNPLFTIVSYIFIVVFTVMSMKAYLGYLTVVQTIRSNEQRKVFLAQETLYLSDFRLPYLESDYAKYFISHENGVANPGEQVIKLIRTPESTNLDQQIISPAGNIKQATPLYSGWAGFFKYKIQKVGEK